MNTTRINISVPNDVKKRMEAFPPTNWSAVAVRAFKQHMGEQVEPTFAELVAEVRKLREIVKSNIHP